MADAEVIRIKGTAKKKRVTFELEGVDGNVETFTSRRIPGWTYTEYWSDMADLSEMEDRFTEEALKDEKNRREALKEARRAGSLIRIFEEAFGDPDEFARFKAFVRDPDNGIDMEALQRLFFKLTESSEEPTPRPTTPSAQSQRGRPNTKAGSKASAAGKA